MPSDQEAMAGYDIVAQEVPGISQYVSPIFSIN
jgi:hypothetical protein